MGRLRSRFTSSSASAIWLIAGRSRSTQAGRPQIERPGLAVVPVGYVVVLAVPRRVVAVLPEHLSEGSDTFRHERVVTRETGNRLHDDTGRGGVVITSGQERRAGG
jgi:hypothetical protein